MPDHLREKDGRPRIPSEAYDIWETIILSDQIARHQVQALLAANPDFATWYRERAGRRRGAR